MQGSGGGGGGGHRLRQEPCELRRTVDFVRPGSVFALRADGGLVVARDWCRGLPVRLMAVYAVPVTARCVDLQHYPCCVLRYGLKLVSGSQTRRH